MHTYLCGAKELITPGIFRRRARAPTVLSTGADELGGVAAEGKKARERRRG